MYRAFVVAIAILLSGGAACAQQKVDFEKRAIGNELLGCVGRSVETSSQLLAALSRVFELEAQIKSLSAKDMPPPLLPDTLNKP